MLSSNPEKREREENTQERNLRNFRSTYYEKVGFRGLDGTKSLELIFNEKPFSLVKLESFAHKFFVPQVHREKVWMLLLGLITPDGDYEEFILKERKLVCQDLMRPLFVLGFLDDNTSKAMQISLMYLLNQGSFSIHTYNQINDTEKKNLLAIATTFCDISPVFENTFWLFKEFIDRLKLIKIFVSEVKSEIKSELQLKQPELDGHLTQVKAYDHLPLQIWSERCFAGIIDPDSIFKVWDKVIAGSYAKIFPALCKYLIIILRTEIMELNHATAIRNILLQPIQVDVKFEGVINCCCSCDDKVGK